MPSEFVDFAHALTHSGQHSVDQFLEHRAKEFMEIGKLSIAYCLIRYEDERKLFRPKLDCGGGDWYEYLFGKLNAPFPEFAQNQLSVVTFNYDRSLEHYLLTANRNSYKKSLEECAPMFQKIRFIHVYGQLGEYPYPDTRCHKYRPENDEFTDVVRASRGIKLLFETSGPLAEARSLLTAAKKVCFLGFGYDPLNLERLKLQDSSSQRNAFGTARGLKGVGLTDVKDNLRQTLLCPNITLDGEDNLTLLQYYRILG